MRRRTLLASLAAGSAGLAGCAFGNRDAAPGVDRDPTTSPPPTRTTPDGETPPDGTTDPGGDGEGEGDELRRPESGTSVVEFRTVPRTHAFGPTTFHTDDGAEVALWFDRTATADHPARLRGWLRNENDFENVFRVRWIPAVGEVRGRPPARYDYDAGLSLAPTAGNDLAATVPEVARPDDGLWYARDGDGPWVVDTRRLGPGEHVELAYHLVGRSGTPGRPTGAYEFRGDDRTITVSVWNTDSPGPADAASSRFAGRSVPPLEDRTAAGDAGGVTWYHAADRTTRAFVRPSTERVRLDGAVTFEVVNHSHGTLRCGHWNLHKLVDGRWFHVGPAVHTSDCRGLRPGGRKRWTLRAFAGDPVDCECTAGRDGFTRGYLGGGTYAVVAGYGHGSDASGALVSLVGDAVDVTPTDGARVVRDGDVVTVTTPHHGDGERPPDATVALERAPDADPEERLIAEQVMGGGGFLDRRSVLRNSLGALFPGVDRVVVRTDDRGADAAVGYDATVRRFRFRGEAYELRRVGGGT